MLLIIVVTLLVGGGLAFWIIRNKAPRLPGPREQIRLGAVRTDNSSLIWIAENRGYFGKEGLDVAIKEYQSGNFAFNDLMADRLEIATCGDFALVSQSLQRQDFRMVAAIEIDPYDW